MFNTEIDLLRRRVRMVVGLDGEVGSVREDVESLSDHDETPKKSLRLAVKRILRRNVVGRDLKKNIEPIDSIKLTVSLFQLFWTFIIRWFTIIQWFKDFFVS